MKDSPILLLLVLGLLGFIGFNWWKKQQTATDTDLKQRDDKIAALETTIGTLGDQLKDLLPDEEEG